MSQRLDVRKTYKLYIGGKFARSESGRSYVVSDAKGAFLANTSRASRKDARDAVVAARAAFAGWSGATAYHRGQVLYRVAEVMEGRAEQFAAEVAAGEGLRLPQARSVVSAAIDRWVWYAGWTDKLSQVVGSTNPVAGPYFNFSIPEPTGVVAVLAPQEDSLLGLVSVIAPALAGGNVVVAVSSQRKPLPAITLAEALATSDVPGGVVNLLTGSAAEIGPWLAEHGDVNALDLTGTVGATADGKASDAELARDLEAKSAGTLKRVRRPPVSRPDWTAEPGLSRMTAFLETKTVWHPIGV
ncbi:MAG: aldehyde dehydrogenase family protein [Geodermatophilaceae bacterium]